MCVLYFAGESAAASRSLQNVLEMLVMPGKLETFRTVDSLKNRLRQPTGITDSIAVLFTRSKQELVGLLRIADLLSDLRIVLLLPDDHVETIASGHLLRPRFLSHVDGDVGEVAAVLQKMLAARKRGRFGAR